MTTVAPPYRPWPQQPLAPTQIPVGPCAWRVTMLAGEQADYVLAHRSLIVVDAEDGDDLLRAAGRRLGDLPVMLNVREPSFARRLPELIAGRLGALGRSRVEVLTLWVEEVTDLKGGVLLQMLRRLRDEGMVGYVGLGHRDIRHAEWLALHTPARVLVLPFGLKEQDGRYRTIGAAREYGMARVAATAVSGEEEMRFALGAVELVLPVLDQPIPPRLTPMDAEEIERVWRGYQDAHAEPAPLDRGRPPE